MSFEIVAACCLASLTPAHALPDNHLERAVQVYVYPARIEVHYHVGLTDQQVARELGYLLPGESFPDDPAAALRRYEEVISPRLASGLELTVNGEVVPLTVRGIDRYERHHQRFVVQCAAPISLGPDASRIELRDTAPPGAAVIECHRMALRGRGEVVVQECSAPPTLVRVPRAPAPARADPNGPSRRLVAICRVPGDSPSAESGTAIERRPETPAESEDARPGTGGGVPVAAVARGKPAEGTARGKPREHPRPTGWIVVGVCLILAGCIFAAAAARNAKRR